MTQDAESVRPDDETIKAVLVFADGLAFSETGFFLADLFNEECPQAAVLRWAGCWPRKERTDG